MKPSLNGVSKNTSEAPELAETDHHPKGKASIFPFMIENQKKALETEKIGTTCADGGTCHHYCKKECSRKDGCYPFTDSGLDDHWQAIPTEADFAKLEQLLLQQAVSDIPLDQESSIPLKRGPIL